MIKALEIIEQLQDPPEVVYCEDEQEKFIAIMVDNRKPHSVLYVLYPVKDRSEYSDWETFRDSHVAKQRTNHNLIDWNSLWSPSLL